MAHQSHSKSNNHNKPLNLFRIFIELFDNFMERQLSVEYEENKGLWGNLNFVSISYLFGLV